MKSNVVAVLKTLRALKETLRPKGAWTTKVLARDKYGRSTAPNHPGATSWCLVGALTHVAPGDLFTGQATIRNTTHAYLCKTLLLRDELGYLERWNDKSCRLKKDVMKLIDDTIKHVKVNNEK